MPDPAGPDRTRSDVAPQESATPDVTRIDLGFDAADPAMARRTRVGTAVLVSGALTTGVAIARFAPRTTMRGLERRWARAVVRAGRITLDVDGVTAIDRTRQYIVMPLHESFVDIPVLLHLPLPLRFTVRDELLTLPRIGAYLAATNQIAVPEVPDRSDLRTIAAGVEASVAAGESVVVFPQGSILGIETAFASGARWLARMTGLPVLPVVITGTHQVWEYPFSQTVRYDQSVTLHVLDPVPPEHLSRPTMRQLEREMKAVALAAANPVRRFVPARDGWWDGYRFAIDPDFAKLHAAFAARRSVRGDGDAG